MHVLVLKLNHLNSNYNLSKMVTNALPAVAVQYSEEWQRY